MHQSVSVFVCVLELACAVQHSGGTARIFSFASKTINWIQVMIYELIVVHFIVVYVFCRSISNGIQTIKFIKNSFMGACVCVSRSRNDIHHFTTFNVWNIVEHFWCFLFHFAGGIFPNFAHRNWIERHDEGIRTHTHNGKEKKDFVSEMETFTVCSVLLKYTIYFTDFFLLFFSHSVFVICTESAHTHVHMLNITKTNNCNNSSENSLTINSTPKKAHELKLNLISHTLVTNSFAPSLSRVLATTFFIFPAFLDASPHLCVCVVRLHLHTASVRKVHLVHKMCAHCCICLVV